MFEIFADHHKKNIEKHIEKNCDSEENNSEKEEMKEYEEYLLELTCFNNLQNFTPTTNKLHFNFSYPIYSDPISKSEIKPPCYA